MVRKFENKKEVKEKLFLHPYNFKITLKDWYIDSPSGPEFTSSINLELNSSSSSSEISNLPLNTGISLVLKHKALSTDNRSPQVTKQLLWTSTVFGNEFGNEYCLVFCQDLQTETARWKPVSLLLSMCMTEWISPHLVKYFTFILVCSSD